MGGGVLPSLRAEKIAAVVVVVVVTVVGKEVTKALLPVVVVLSSEQRRGLRVSVAPVYILDVRRLIRCGPVRLQVLS